VDKVNWALSNNEQANLIANAGHLEVTSHHTYDHRAKEILRAFSE
jgi:hypothetical protein